MSKKSRFSSRLGRMTMVAVTVVASALAGVEVASADSSIWLTNDIIGLDMHPWGSDNFHYPLDSNNLYSSGGQRLAVRYDDVFKWSKGAGTMPDAPLLAIIEEMHYIEDTPEQIVVGSTIGDDVVEIDSRITIIPGAKWVGLEYTLRNISSTTIDLTFYQGDDFDVDHNSSSNDVGKYDETLRLLMEWDYDGFPYVGVAAVTPPKNFDVADYDDLWQRILNDDLLNRDYFSGDPAVAFEWKLGSMPPGQSVTVFKVMAAGDSEDDLKAEIDNGMGWLIAYPVEIDIKPGGEPNAINLDSKGNVAVAVLSDAELNAADVDPSTVTFSSAALVRYSYEDVDRDGDIDLVLHFSTQDLLLTESSTTATLLGRTYGGEWVSGSDSIKIIVRGGDKPKKSGKLQSGLYNIGIGDCDVAAISGNIVAISMDEGEDSIDYNGDGDTRDRILGYYNISKEEATNIGISIGGNVAIDGDLIAFELRENSNTLAYYSIRTGEMVDTGIRIYRFGSGSSGPTRAISDGRIVYQDISRQICTYDTATGQTVCTGKTGYYPSISGDIVAYTTSYRGTVRYIDLTTGEVHDTDAYGEHAVVNDGIIVFESSDGIAYYDIDSGVYSETVIPEGYDASVDNGLISAFVNERDVDRDLNGDGDITDRYMIMVYNIRTGELINTGVQGCCGTDISNGVVIFDKYEGENDPEIDYNGDGDTNDCVQHYLVLDLKRTGNGRVR